MAGRARRLCHVAAMAFLLGAPAAARAACDRVTWTTLPTPDDIWRFRVDFNPTHKLGTR